MLDSILNDLKKYLNLNATKGLAENVDYYHLEISENILVSIKDMNPGIFMKSTIASMSQTKDAENFFSYLMRANFLGSGTGEAVISLDPDEKFFVLIMLISHEINYKIFRDKLEDFVNYIEYWRKEITNYEARQV